MTEQRYDAVLLVSFGGPEGPDDVLPFLRNVTAGRDVPEERLTTVAEQYAAFGGISPINDQCRALLAALRVELDDRGHDLPLYWGNRNWTPYLTDTVADMAAAGHHRVLAVVTSAYSSYSACRQYLDDIEAARLAVGPSAPIIDKVRPYWNHPGFVDAQTDRVVEAVGRLPPEQQARARLAFTAHSIPVTMADTCDYEDQLRDVAAVVADRVAPGAPWDLVFQSRSGPPQVPWLEPDIGDHLRSLAADDPVVVVPVGFVSDHMEVVYDLDTQAAAVAEEVGLTMVRAGTVGTHPAFVAGLVDLLEEHLSDREPAAVGSLGPRAVPCVPGCCPAPVRRARP